MKTNLLLSLAVLAAFSLGAAGCGKASDAAKQQATEKAIEAAMSGEGKNVDVKLGKDGNVASMSIKGKDGDGGNLDMTMNSNGGQMTIKATDENGKAVDIQMNGNGDNSSMTIQGDDGAMKMLTGDAAKVPEDFPKDIPQYPGLKVTMVQTMAEQQMYHIQAQTPDAMDKVATFCKEQYKAQGWTEQSSMNQGGDAPMTMLSYEKGERILNIVLSKDGDATVVSLNTGLQ